MLDRTLVFLDLETTGASPSSDRITEIGLVEVDRGDYIGEWSSLVNPGCGIPTGIQQLTGITDDMVRNAPAFSELAEALHRRLEGKVLVAHNARFDHGFLSTEFRRLGMRYQPEILCTVKLSRRLFPQHPRHNLDSVIERHGLACHRRHRALADAQVLWQFAREIQIDPGMDAVRCAVEDLLRKPRLPPALAPHLLDEVPQAPGAYVVYGAQGAALFVGKSMNLSSRILAHFSDESTSARDCRIAAEATHIEWSAAAGELGVSIRHAALVQRLNPPLNRRRRLPQAHYAFRWHPVDGPCTPVLVETADVDFSGLAGLYGPFRSQRIALNAMRDLADAHGLCHFAVGIEQGGGGPCLGRRLNRCMGLCTGAETPIAHAMRMTQALHALRLHPWPFAGPIGIVERDPVNGHSEVHLFEHWRHLGSYDSVEALRDGLDGIREPCFDLESYRLLRRFLTDKPRDIELVHFS